VLPFENQTLENCHFEERSDEKSRFGFTRLRFFAAPGRSE
jgi:hypothetical protein